MTIFYPCFYYLFTILIRLKIRVYWSVQGTCTFYGRGKRVDRMSKAKDEKTLFVYCSTEVPNYTHTPLYQSLYDYSTVNVTDTAEV